MLFLSLAVVGSAIALSRVAPSLSSSLVLHAPIARAAGEMPGFDSFQLRVGRNIRLWKGSLQDEQLAQEAQRAALEELVHEAIVRDRLEQAGMSVDSSSVEQEYARMLVFAGGADALASELALYNWTESEFKEEVVLPAVERAMLQRLLYANLPEQVQEREEEARDTAIKLGTRLPEGLEVFSDEDVPLGASVSELGWVQTSQIDPWFAEALVDASVGTVTSPVRSPLGLHVFFIVDEREEDIERELFVSEVLVDAPEYFEPWLQSEFATEDVAIYLPGLYWESGRVVAE